MEHRYSARHPYQGTVWIEWSRGSVLGFARDLSAGGIGVDTGGVALPLYALVSVGFAIEDAFGPRRLHVPGMVVRHSPTGAGIMFVENAFDIAAVRRLAAIGPLAPRGALPAVGVQAPPVQRPAESR